ncbi:hypothetical protein M426DRAFT_74983 [Hypoxylon sp. CI-4A]|nr:hypothetical protein M426DRAFT_74983 [Hypoxylon sp. CI-4A]
MQVVCAWPVSGQYGPGSRILYYALVAACVFARKFEWARNACLAAALIFPAVAALHGIVLAAVHVDGAVDMDVYGAFQFCTLGILAAPLTARISSTYFNDPARNIIFLWTSIILAGLLSLIVEFFRIPTLPCPFDENHNPVNPNDIKGFLQRDTVCKSDIGTIDCSMFSSPLRQGSTNEIYTIPAPHVLSFNAATLLAAACCIPAVLSLASMWNKILEINWKNRFGKKDEDKPIEGTNGATIAGMSRVNRVVKKFLGIVETLVLGSAILAILIFGERNFWSQQVNWQTEPMQSIGQWAPIVGTALAALGSVYVLLVAEMKVEEAESYLEASDQRHCNCSHHHFDHGKHSNPYAESDSDYPRGSTELQGIHSVTPDSLYLNPTTSPPTEGPNGLFVGPSHHRPASNSADIQSSSSNSEREHSTDIADQQATHDIGNRRKIRKMLWRFSDYLGTAAQDRFDDSEFRQGKALDFPEVPAEELRNPDLHHIRKVYNPHCEDEPAPSIRTTRAGSFVGSVASRSSVEGGGSAISRIITAPPLSRSASPAPTALGVLRASTLPVTESSTSPLSATPMRGRSRQRSDTLEVPAPVHHNPSSSWSTQSTSPATPVTTTITNSQGSPTIMISSDTDMSPVVEDPIIFAPPEPKPS